MIVLASRHRTLVLENLALQQQLAVYRRTRPKPAIRWSDRLFWIGLRWAWRDWKLALALLRETDEVVVRQLATVSLVQLARHLAQVSAILCPIEFWRGRVPH